MPRQFQFAKTSLTSVILLIAQLQVSALKNDPLIDKGAENTVLLGVALLAIAVVVIVRIISPRVEHAVIAAIILSSGLIGLFFTFGH